MTEMEWDILKDEKMTPEKLSELKGLKWFKKLKQRLSALEGNVQPLVTESDKFDIEESTDSVQ